MKNIVTLVYKYINEFIDENELLASLDGLISQENDPVKKDSLSSIKSKVTNEMNLHDIGTCILYDKLYTILTTDGFYRESAINMSDKELMLMITEYLYANYIPHIDQETFDSLVDAAIDDKKTAKENCWRLAHNYSGKSINFEKIVDYLISTRDAWYVMELFHSVGDDLNLDEMIDKLITTQDKEFIKRLLEDNLLDTIFKKEQIEILKKQF